MLVLFVDPTTTVKTATMTVYSFTALKVWFRNNYVAHKDKGSFYIAQYPVRWTAQSASDFFPPMADSDTVLGFSGKHSSDSAITLED